MKWTQDRPSKVGWYHVKYIDKTQTVIGLLKFKMLGGILVIIDRNTQIPKQFIENSKHIHSIMEVFYSDQPIPEPEN